MLNEVQLLALLKTSGIGKKTVLKILTGLPSTVTNDQLLDELERTNKAKFLTLSSFLREIEEVSESIQRMEKLGIKPIGISNPDFPMLLKDIPDPPVLLYYKGNINALKNSPTAAVIGTREPTDYGKRLGVRTGEILAENGVTVVSGLAFGCDTTGHAGCLNKKGKTVAILAHGLKYVYPKSNSQLASQILENDGCLLSEYGFDVEPTKFSYVERDRLQSGSSLATIVIETDVKGGTMHTVKFTKDQNRLLFCIDHPEDKQSSKSNGNQFLLRTGDARPLRDNKDFSLLLDELRVRFHKSGSINSNVNENDGQSEELTKNELLTRLNFSSSEALDRAIEKGELGKFTIKHDPEKIEWMYDAHTRKFIKVQGFILK